MPSLATSAALLEQQALPEFAVNSESRSWGVILSVEGDLDRTNVAEVQREAESERTRADGPLRSGGLLVLDLSRTTFMDTSGLRLIHDLHRGSASGTTARLVVVGTPRVARVLALAPSHSDVVVVTVEAAEAVAARARGGGGRAVGARRASGGGGSICRGHSLGARW